MEAPKTLNRPFSEQKTNIAPKVNQPTEEMSPKTAPSADKKKVSTTGNSSKNTKTNALTSGNGTFSLSNSLEALNVDNTVNEEVNLGDDEGKPLEKIDYTGDHDKEDEVEPVDNEMTSFLASKPTGFSDIDFGISKGGAEQNQFDSLLELVSSVNLVPLADRWVWKLEGTGVFSVASARRLFDELRLPNLGMETRWIKCVPIKINVLAWKIWRDALPTRFNISRRGIDVNNIRVPICDNAIESSEHLFFRCSLIRDIGKKIMRWWNLDFEETNSYDEWKILALIHKTYGN
ncbi:RNA-directed DNA polymerase, eukaryota [Tanacetum coccineum]